MPRPATPDIRITEGLQPAAAPVDTYVRPVTPQESNLTDVARSLSNISTPLADWAAKEDEKRKANDAIRGEAQFHKDNEIGYAEGVRQGVIPPNKSPEFVNGYKRAQGSTAGFQLESDLSASFDKWDGKTDGNPDAFNAWFRDNTAGKITTDDPEILKGLVPHMRELQNKFHDRWQAEVSKNTQYTGQAAFSGLMASTIDAYQRDGIANKQGTDYATLGTTLDAIREKGFEIGIKKAKIDELMIDAITTRAEVHRDGDLLKLLDTRGASGINLAETPYGQAKKLATTNTLMSIWKTETAEERARVDREDRKNAQAAKGRITDSLLKNPDAELDESDLKTIQKLDGNFKLDVMEWRKKVRENDIAEDPSKVAQVYQEILSGGGQDALWKGVRSEVIRNPDTMAKAQTFVKAMDDYAKQPGKVLEGSAAKSYLKQIETMGQDSRFSASRILGDSTMTEDGRRAMRDYRYGMMLWQTQNPNASVLEQEKRATELGEQVVKGLGVGSQQGKYAPSPEVQEVVPQGPFGPPRPSPTTGGAAPQSRAAVPATPPATAEETPAWLQKFNAAKDGPPSIDSLGIPPDELERINARAASQGKSPQDLINEKWRGMNSGRPQLPAAPERRSSLELPGGLGRIELANLSEDQAQSIRDTIAHLTFPMTGTRGQFSQGGTEHVNAQRIADIKRSAVGPLIDEVARQTTFDPDKLAAIVSVESAGDPKAKAGIYSGLLQLSPQEFAKYGDGRDIFDARSNLIAGVKSLQEKEHKFKSEFGREPSAVELYLMHQQGEAGLRAHEANLDAPAWQNMYNTGEGKKKGVGWAKLAVWGNVPSDLRETFGSVDNMTSREFIAAWTSKLKGIPYRQALAEVSEARA